MKNSLQAECGLANVFIFNINCHQYPGIIKNIIHEKFMFNLWSFMFKIKKGSFLFRGPAPSLFPVLAYPDRDSASTHRSSTSGAPACVCTSTLASAGCPSSPSGHTMRNTFWYVTHTGSPHTHTPRHRPYSGLATCLLRRPENFPAWLFIDFFFFIFAFAFILLMYYARRMVHLFSRFLTQRSVKEMDEKMNESYPTFIHSFTTLIHKKLGHFFSDLTFIFLS